MSTSPGQGIPDDMSQLVSSIREVQKMQGQVREKLAAVQAQQNKPPPASTAGGPTGTCTGLNLTTGCKADMPWDSMGQCMDSFAADQSGYCQCGNVKIGFDCNGGQNGQTCKDICAGVGAAAYGPMPATDVMSCLQGGGVFVGQGGAGFAASSPGTAFPGCPADAKCCVPLGGTINVSDADEIYVTGARGPYAYMNGTYTPAPVSQYGPGMFIRDPKGPVMKTIGRGATGTWGIQGTTIASGAGVSFVAASGPFAKDPQRIPVGGHSDPWLSDTGDSADASGIRLAAASKTDVASLGKQHAELSSKLQELEGIETTLLDELRTQRLAASDDASASSLALRAETKAAAMVHAESEEQRRRLARQRGISAKDTTLIVAARSAALRAAAYGRLTIVALGILIAAFIVYRLNITGIIGPDAAFLLAAAAGGAGLIVGTAMLNNIHSRSQRDFSKFYFPPPAGPSVLAGTPGGSSAGKSDHGSLRSCERALHASRSA